MRNPGWVWALAVALAAGCGSSGQQVRSGAQTGEGGVPDPLAGACPATVEGTQMETREIAGGIEVFFRTEADDRIAELQDTVRRLSEKYEEGPGGDRSWFAGSDETTDTTAERSAAAAAGAERSASGSGSGSESGASASGAAIMPVRSRTMYEAIDDGARIRFVPENSEHTEALRRQVRHMVERVSATGRCDLSFFGGAIDANYDLPGEDRGGSE